MVWCRCRCHGATRGDLSEAAQRGNAPGVEYYAGEPLLELPPMVAVTDRLEAAVACGCTCERYHQQVYVSRAKYLPPNPWTPDATGDTD